MAETPYPNNSHTARERKPEGSNPPEKKLEKVVSGGAKTRKKSEVKKFANIGTVKLPGPLIRDTTMIGVMIVETTDGRELPPDSSMTTLSLRPAAMRTWF